METLGLSDAPQASEGRIKSLFWPSIRNGMDVDNLGTQGYWVCTCVAVLSLALLTMHGQAVSAIAIFLFYYLGGVGVRERSRYAAIVVFLMYLLDTLTAPGILRIIISALLLSNLRGTWIASRWTPGSDEAILPSRLNETFTDKLVDQFPAWLWPKLRIDYYVGSSAFLLLVIAALLHFLF